MLICKWSPIVQTEEEAIFEALVTATERAKYGAPDLMNGST